MPEVWRQFAQTNYSNLDPASGLVALQSVATMSTADLVASLVSELPADVMSGKSKRPTPWNIEDPGDDGAGREDWLYRLIMSWLIRGNAFGAETSWDARTGRALSVDLLSPTEVRPQKVGDEVQWYHKGARIEGEKLTEFRHWPVNRQPGVLLGLSVVEQHAVSIGISLRSAQFGDQWFRDGAHPSGLLTNKARLDDVDAEQAKRRLKEVTQGNRDPLVLGEGWEYKALQLSPNESQFLETQKYSEAQCARMFGPIFAELLGYESGNSMTYANVVERRQDVLVLSINKWIRRAERVLSSLLPPSTQRVKLNREALLEATTLQRYQAHGLSMAWKTINEIREIEGDPPIAGGDVIAKTPSSQGVTSGNAAQS